jgi:hypothetical protein
MSADIHKFRLVSIAVPREWTMTEREKRMFKLLLETSARITRTIGDDRHACLRSEDLRTGTLKLLKRQNSGINRLVIRAGQCEDKVLDIPLIENLSSKFGKYWWIKYRSASTVTIWQSINGPVENLEC